jgi:Na+/H+-dicarboxylate symporter
MLKVTGYVMLFAPLAVFGALAAASRRRGSRSSASTASSWASSISA